MYEALKILLIEDDVDDQVLIKKELGREGHVISCVFSGEECLKVLEEHDFDVILIDYSLPRENGLLVLSKIIAKNIDSSVIMITGHGDEKIAADSIKQGAFDYVVKSELSRLKISIASAHKRVLERKRVRASEKALLENEAKYRRLVEASPDITYMYDSSTGVSFWSHRVEEILGFTSSELQENPFLWYESIHKDDFVQIDKIIYAAKDGEKAEAEYRIKGKNGKWHWFYDRVFSVEWNGVDVVIEGLISDITKKKESEMALRESEEKLSMLFSSMNEGVCLHDILYDNDDNMIDFRITDCNPAFEKMTGISGLDGAGILVSDLFGGKKSHHVDIISKLGATGEPQVFETFFAPTEKHFLISAFKLSKRRFGTVIMDITERKKNAEEQEKLLMLIENTSDFIGISSLSGHVTYLNDAAMKLVGLEDPKAVRKTKLTDFFDDPVKRELKKVIKPEVIKKGSWRGQVALKHFKTGEYINVEAHAFIIRSRETNAPLAFAAVMRDISEQLIINHALEAIVGGVLGETGEGFFRSVALYLTKHLKVDYAFVGELFDGNKCSRTIAVAYRDSIVDNFEYNLEDTPCNDVVKQSICSYSSGICKEFPQDKMLVNMGIESYCGIPLIDKNQGPVGLLSVMHKQPVENLQLIEAIMRILSVRVTAEIRRMHEEEERKKLEEQLYHSQKMEAIGSLAGGIAHDFNNILAAINGYAELAMNTADKDTQVYSDLQEILNAGKRARDLVGQILMISRLKKEEAHPVMIGPIAKEVYKFLRASLPTTIEMNINLAMELKSVVADPVQLHQVMMNLCTNGASSMKNTGGTLGILLENMYVDNDFASLTPPLSEGAHVHLSVTDTGSGIPDDIKERIFDPYFTTKNVGEGTGLGLAIVHGIIEGYNGAITVDTVAGEGSTFHIYLPTVDQSPKSVSKLEVTLPGGTETLLFIDDEESIVFINTRLFESLGYTVKAFTDSEAAMAEYEKNPDAIDLVITDMTMPKLTGFDVAEKMIALRQNISIILCTGYSSSVSPEALKSSGIKKLLMKPISSDKIAVEVRKILDSTDTY